MTDLLMWEMPTTDGYTHTSLFIFTYDESEDRQMMRKVAILKKGVKAKQVDDSLEVTEGNDEPKSGDIIVAADGNKFQLLS